MKDDLQRDIVDMRKWIPKTPKVGQIQQKSLACIFVVLFIIIVAYFFIFISKPKPTQAERIYTALKDVVIELESRIIDSDL